MSTFKRRGNLKFKPGEAWSYGTRLIQTTDDGLTVGNITRYSVTTSKHQGIAAVRQCDILVDNIPMWTQDLLKYVKREG